MKVSILRRGRAVFRPPEQPAVIATSTSTFQSSEEVGRSSDENRMKNNDWLVSMFQSSEEVGRSSDDDAPGFVQQGVFCFNPPKR